MAEFTSLNGFMVKDATARNIAKGRNQSVAYSDYATMIEALNAMEKDEFKTGQNIYIGTVGVPDLWVYAVEPIRHTFTYVSDEGFAEMLKENITVQVGFFKLAMLEGQKVDLTTVNEQLAEHTEDITELNKNITSLQSSFQTGCSTIAAAITAMGVSTSSTASPATMAANIKKINTGGMELIGFHAQNLKGSTGAADYTISEDLTGYEKVYVITFWARNQSGFSGLIYGGYPTATFSNCTATRVSGTESSSSTHGGSIVTLLTNITGTVKMTNMFYGNDSGDGYVILFGEPK